MTQEQLQDRIQKANIKIEKIEKRIKKWQNAQTREAFLKADGWLLNMGRDEEYLWNEYIKDCNKELDYAIQDLHDAQVTLEKYQNMLNLEVAKDNEFENNRIQVIWEFLLNYKEQVAEYIRDNLEVLNEYYEVSSKMCDWHNHNSYKVYNGEMTREEYNKVYNELKARERELQEAIHPYTKECATRDYTKENSQRYIDENKLEEILLKDCKARYFQLVKEVTQYTGIITDAQGLRIKAGELNGIIIGEKGKAKVQTFSAGGHSMHIIVNEKHGQCFHYRTRVDKVD